ncbi:MAG TPA: 3D-(3,5/4)-trihydroxycyclohexane-1,2-dione acylhydrolase (decyclizing) [Anaerolineales bacterium]|nr:3D-(3,5/4)-trihydroxycyclohexane-1,2-dione acylhydrolase (decyclizing) [Anaerolineales bacterium]
METIRLTMAQAVIRFLTNQFVERDGVHSPFFAGCFGIFGHGNVAGIGQALQEYPAFRYYLARNEQAMVHTAAAYAKMKNRLQTFACTTSIGPGATNMLTAAAGATINRLPVLLLPGDIFARRNVAPVLQQLELPHSQDISVNDCFKPVSRYWDRINRPEQAIHALPEALRTLTSQADTGAVTLALPQDVQAEAWDYPAALFEPRTWTIPRPLPDAGLLQRAADQIRAGRRPLIVAGGGVIYSEATEALAAFTERTGIPVGETQAGKGSLHYADPRNLGAIGVTGTFGANIMAREADLVIGIGTRYSDFTTASKTAFQDPEVRFININIAEFDAHKHGGLPLTGDARAALEALEERLADWQVDPEYRERAARFNREWDAEVDRIYDLGNTPLPSQGEVIGAVNRFSDDRDVVLCAAGSAPGDLHKLWQTRDPKGYHVEYGYSCMGYEIAGGLGAKLAAPDREIYVVVGDGSYLMMAQEIVTSVQEGVKLTIILIDNRGFGSIGGLSRSLGSKGFGTRYLYRDERTGLLPDDGYAPSDAAERALPVDLAANARSLGAHVIPAATVRDLEAALAEAKRQEQTTVIYIETDRYTGVPGYESWWDVPVAEVSTSPEVREARAHYDENRRNERFHI